MYASMETVTPWGGRAEALMLPIMSNRNHVDALNICSAADAIKYLMICKNLVPSGLGGNIAVRPSSIHGNGVFATSNIPKGKLITMYPADVVSIVEPGRGSHWYRSNGDEISRLEVPLYFRYAARVEGTNISLCGDPDKYSPDVCGHIINDGASLENNTFGPGEMVCYMKLSHRKQNCFFVSVHDCALGVMSVRDIKEGEELLTGYGAEFWANCATPERFNQYPPRQDK